MNRTGRMLCILVVCGLALAARPVMGEKLKLKLKWSQEFAKPVDWYVRTSAGIIVAKSGKSLVGIDELDGSLLWTLSDLDLDRTGKWRGSRYSSDGRAHDVMEIPGMGILLLNRVKLPGDKEGRLMAVNLETGKRLWDRKATDELMTAIPLYAAGEAILVSRRLQMKRLVEETIVAAAVSTQVPLVGFFMTPYPYHFQLTRLDLATGTAKWSEEYDRLFTPGTARFRATEGAVLLYFSNRLMSSFNLENGKLMWEDGEKSSGNVRLPLPVTTTGGKLIYSSEYVRAVEPATQKEIWSIEELGNVTGIGVRDGIVVALGEKKMAAVDLESGKERWRLKTHGQTTNLLWDKATDELIYGDSKGLHAVESATGKTILDIPIRAESWPHLIRQTSGETVVTIAAMELCGYNFKTGKKLFAEGELKSFFRPNSFVDNWPMPEDGEEYEAMTGLPVGQDEWEAMTKTSLFDPQTLREFKTNTTDSEFLDAFETELEQTRENGTTTAKTKISKIWWIDRQTNQQMEIAPAARHHDVDRRSQLVFAINNKQLWAATFTVTDAAVQTGSAAK